jgi:hypothetical protein
MAYLKSLTGIPVAKHTRSTARGSANASEKEDNEEQVTRVDSKD